MDDTTSNYTGWQSDVVVDLIKRYEFPYITLNPGASFRGLHDSLINYGDNQPPMMLCNHEEIAVQIAHGYAKATGKPMAVILHNLVGLLHACMAIYYAYLDRVPIFIIGATGPMDEAKRRPHIDWTHTALVQGNAVRDYVKWDYQPTSIDGVPESFARAYSVMMTEPKGPVYMCYDAALQEAPKTHDVPLPPIHAVAAPSPMAPDPRAIEAIAEKLLKADHPMLLPEYAGRRTGGFESIVELAELTGSAVWDVNNALNFPNKHPLCLSMDKPSLKTTDLIVGLDVKDWEKQLTELNNAKRIRISAARVVRFRRDRLCRGGYQQVGDGLLPHAALLGARARRHHARHSGVDRSLQAADREQRQPPEEDCRPQDCDWQAPRSGLGAMAARIAQGLGRLATHLLAARHGSLGCHQRRGLGAHRQRAQASGPQAVGLR